jgi:hypothetical protein
MAPSSTPKQPKAKAAAQSSTFHVKLDADILAGLAALAEKLGKQTGTKIRQTDLVRRAVRALLEREAKR